MTHKRFRSIDDNTIFVNNINILRLNSESVFNSICLGSISSVHLLICRSFSSFILILDFFVQTNIVFVK